MNTITIELCAEDRARLDAIKAALDKLSHSTLCVGGLDLSQAPDFTATEPAPVEKPVEPVTATAEPKQAAETAESEKSDTPKVDCLTVQQKVVSLVMGGKKEETKQIINAYAPRVSLIPEDKLAEVYEKLIALEG